MDRPTIIKGGVAVDDRGVVTFCNDFDMTPVKRVYMLENHQEGYIRAWHGHLKEAKWVMCVSGVAVVGVVEMDKVDMDHPEFEKKIGRTFAQRCMGMGGLYGLEGRIYRFTLHPNGDILYIPPGYANGHMNLVTGTRVMHFSSMTMDEAEGDDYRFDSGIHGWVWEVKSR